MHEHLKNDACLNFCAKNTKIGLIHFLYKIFTFISQKFYTLFASLFRSGEGQLTYLHL